jgi:hypothetical protein
VRIAVMASSSADNGLGSGGYAWLSQSLFFARGRLTGPRAIAYGVYRVL